MVSYKAPNPPAELLSLTRSSVKRSGRTGQRGLLDLGQAAPVPWHCTSHRAQSKTPEAHLLLKYEEERNKNYKETQTQQLPLYMLFILKYLKVIQDKSWGTKHDIQKKLSVFHLYTVFKICLLFPSPLTNDVSNLGPRSTIRGPQMDRQEEEHYEVVEDRALLGKH